MIGNIIGFVIWAIGGVIIIGLGISAYFSRKVVGFWANIKPISINDIAGYNRAVGKLFVIYGVILIALGLPVAFRTRFSVYFTVSIGRNDRNNSNHGSL